TMNRDAEQLNGWKEIACYMNRSVRCVQRWERYENLPVRRHGHRSGVSVYAFRGELSAWWERECAASKQSNGEPIRLAIGDERAARARAIDERVVLTADTSELGATDPRPVEFALTSHEITAVRFLLTLLSANCQVKSIVPR